MPLKLVTWNEYVHLQAKDLLGFSGAGFFILPKKFHSVPEISRNLDSSAADLAKVVSPDDLDLIHGVLYTNLRDASIAGYRFHSTRGFGVAAAYSIRIDASDHDQIGILGGSSVINHAAGIKIHELCDSARINSMSGYRIGRMSNSSQIGVAYKSNIETMADQAVIEDLSYDSTVETCRDNASIRSIKKNARVGTFSTSAGKPSGSLSLVGN